MEIFAFSGLINGIVALFFGGLVFVKDWRNRENQIFFLMTLAVSLWSFSYWQWLSSSTEKDALMWIKYFSVASMYIPVFFFHWVTRVLKISIVKWKIIVGSYLVVIVFTILSFTPYFIAGVSSKSIFLFWPNPGFIYTLYFVFIYVGLITYSVYLLLKHYKLNEHENKGRIQLILLGAIFGFGGGITNFPLWYDIPLLPYGNFFVALFPVFLGYAALRYSLFNIKVITAELTAFALWVFVLMRLLLSETQKEQIIEGVLLLLVVAAGIIIIRSVRKEVEQREKLEVLTKKLEKANEKLKELDQLKTEFLSLASHQFRSPLTAMKGYASLILEGSYGDVNPAVKDAVDKIFTSSNSLADVVQDFLDVSRIEQGKMKYDFEKVDLKDLTQEVVGELKPNLSQAGLEISLEAPEQNYFVNIDKGKIKQVLINIIDNAQIYTKEGSIKITLRKEKSKVLVAVSDTGIGMTEEEIKKLFGKFVRNEKAKKTNIKGTGLGLYIVKKIIEVHKGKIWVKSEGLGRGSTFFVELDEA